MQEFSSSSPSTPHKPMAKKGNVRTLPLDLGALFTSQHARLQGFLWRQGCSHEVVQELTQEAFLRCLRVPDPHRIADLKGFLFTVAANLARDYFRCRARTAMREFLPLDPALPDPLPPPEESWEAERQMRALEHAIEALPPRMRTVFLLYQVEGRCYREIALALGISTRTVEYHVREALIRCRRYLKAAFAGE